LHVFQSDSRQCGRHDQTGLSGGSRAENLGPRDPGDLQSAKTAAARLVLPVTPRVRMTLENLWNRLCAYGCKATVVLLHLLQEKHIQPLAFWYIRRNNSPGGRLYAASSHWQRQFVLYFSRGRSVTDFRECRQFTGRFRCFGLGLLQVLQESRWCRNLTWPRKQ